MGDEGTRKVVIIATHGPEDQERATLPFMMANAALAMEAEAVVILQGAGVLLAKKGIYEHVCAGGLPLLKDQLEIFMKSGGKLLICTPCVVWRKIEQEMMVDGAELIAGARVIGEALSSAAVLNY